MPPPLPSPHKLAIALLGALLLPLTIVNAFVHVVPFPRTGLQLLFVVIAAIVCIAYGREWRRVPWAARTVRLIAYSPFLALILLIALLHVPVQPLGRMDASRDVAKNLYKVTLGHQPWSKDAQRLLAERYGITADISGGCLTLTFASTYRSGYASVANPAIREKFGYDVVAECIAEARANWQTTHSVKPPAPAP